MITKKDLRLAKAIRKHRKLLGFTQQELADKVDVSQKYVQYLESAKRTPSLKTLHKLVKTLKIPSGELFK